MNTRVYYKWKWADEWIYAPHIEPISATKTAAPAIATAALRLRYGRGTWEDLTAMTDGSLLESFAYCYIQIRGRSETTEIILWTGLVPAETFQLLGKGSSARTVDQILQAYGLDMLLESRLDGAQVEKLGYDVHVWIDHLPTFNRRYEYGGGVIGNRSNRQIEDADGKAAGYVFSDDGDNWTNLDIIKYLLRYYQQDNGPLFSLDAEQEILDALEKIIGVYNFGMQTVRAALNTLINRGRGFGWTYTVDSNDKVELTAFSLLDEEMILGDVTMPANKNKVALNLWEDKTTTVNIVQDTMHCYDKIVVRGARIKSCCSLALETIQYPPSIEQGWTDAEETAYKNAAKNTDDYDLLDDYEKPELNDKFRATDRFSRVFTTFRIPHTWDWTIWDSEGLNSDFVNPLLVPGSTGEIDTERQATFFNVDKRLLTFVPLKVGVDYGDIFPDDKNPADSEPEYRKMFVLVKDRNGQYQYAEKLENPAIIRPLMREMGLEMRFKPAYLAALNHWADAEPGQSAVGGEIEYQEGLGIDYESLIATVFMETDQHVQLSYNLTNYENKRVLTIDIPDAELWYIVPETVIDVDANGELIHYGGIDNVLRDDTNRMRSALTAAVGWYGRRHNKVNIAIKALVPGAALGTLITNVDVAGVGAAGSVVTSVGWNFQNRPAATTIQTDFAALNIAGMFGLGGSPRGGTAGTPGTRTAARKIDAIEKDINTIKTELGKSPLRIEIGGGTSRGILARITETLRRADETVEPPVETIEHYKIKLLGSAAADEWAADHGEYTEGDIAKYGEDALDYQCIVTHESEEAKNPANTTFWKCLGAGLDAWVSGYAGENLLETIPWFQIDDIVEVEYHSGKWWIKETVICVKILDTTISEHLSCWTLFKLYKIGDMVRDWSPEQGLDAGYTTKYESLIEHISNLKNRPHKKEDHWKDHGLIETEIKESDCSLAWNETDKRAMGVF